MKLLFIHGAGGTKNKWRAIGEHLKGVSYDVIDLPGHGDNEYNIITSIQDYAAYIDQSIMEDTIVIGHSMGGLIALELANRNNQIKGVVLAASFYELPVHPKLLETLANGEYPQSLFHASYHQDAGKELIEEERKELASVPIEIAYADFKACQEYKEGKVSLSKLQIPICAILGDKDKLLPRKSVEMLKELKPDMKIVEISGSGHYVMLESPDSFIKELLHFMKDIKAQTVK
ncbi:MULTISPECIES: alpha/beta fold hydrolase [Bacillus]|uniref:alpha/beta fold hydrolase n=1 Tax=Bacillus TaxID=1386 RepID=UPI0002EEB4BE|nr:MULTISPECIES: alpha/beta hydrolase [Bacillus]